MSRIATHSMSRHYVRVRSPFFRRLTSLTAIDQAPSRMPGAINGSSQRRCSYFSSQKYAFGSARRRIFFRWFGRFAFFEPFSSFHRLKGQNSSDIDQIVGNHAQSNPSFHAVIAPISTAIQTVSSFKHTDPAFASGSPSLGLPKPSLLL